ncbi:preprotein translocase subunit SecE [bacterium]|nr:preprotein translocase subunit SecE [bacterium]
MAEKLGVFDKTKIFLGEVRTEMTKVVYPTPQEVKTYVIVVLISTAVISVAMGLWDMLLGHIVNWFFQSVA